MSHQLIKGKLEVKLEYSSEVSGGGGWWSMDQTKTLLEVNIA